MIETTTNNKIYLQIFDKAIRVFTGFMVAIYGLAKPFQFSYIKEYIGDEVISELTGMQLMWYFFGYSSIVPITIGVFQVIGSIFLLFNKTKLIGIAMLLPILFNIVLFDLVYEVNLGATIYGIIFLIFLLLSAAIDFKRIIIVFKSLITYTHDYSKKETITIWVLGIFFGILIFFFFQLLLNYNH